MIAALYVAANGSYIGLPGVDPWDEKRDARKYRGPWPVVCHSPCPRWGKMWFGQPLTVKLTGERRLLGDDDGCYAHALWCARTFGGVIEHPWASQAWPYFGIKVPAREGGWIEADEWGGMTCCVEQGQYGHYARKPTLLLAYKCVLPELKWGKTSWEPDPATVARMGLKRAKKLGEMGAKGGGKDSAPRINTPEPFRDLLLSIARTAQPMEKAA